MFFAAFSMWVCSGLSAWIGFCTSRGTLLSCTLVSQITLTDPCLVPTDLFHIAAGFALLTFHGLGICLSPSYSSAALAASFSASGNELGGFPLLPLRHVSQTLCGLRSGKAQLKSHLPGAFRGGGDFQLLIEFPGWLLLFRQVHFFLS